MNFKAGMTAVAAAAVAVGLAACGSSAAPGITTAPSAGDTATTFTPTLTVATPTSGALAKEPTITRPTAPAPTTLVKKDLIVGTGATAAAGDSIAVNYIGEIYSNAKVFDASWKDTPGKAADFTLGGGTATGDVIQGWDEGVVGMKVGGRRELIIPPALGYGATGSSTVPKNATLIFVIDLLKVAKPTG